MPLERRLAGGARVAGMEVAQGLLRFGRPVRPIRRVGKPKARRQEHRAGGDIAGGVEVALHEHRRHGHRLADIRKTLAADGVGRKLAGHRRPHVDACEIADGAVVCNVTQPPQHHRPGVAGPRGRLRIERRGEPAEQLLPLGVARLRGLPRRHVAEVQPLEHMLEHRRPGDERLGGSEAGQIEIVVLGLGAVAVSAGLHHERMNLRGIRLREIIRTTGDGSGEHEARQRRKPELLG